MASCRLTWRTLGKHTNTCNQTARNRKENGFNNQEGDSEQDDLLGAKSSLAGRTSPPGPPRRPQAEIERTWTPRTMESILLALTARLDGANRAR